VADRITSTTNPTIKRLVRLHTRRERDRTGTFPVEGHREIERALAAGIAVDLLAVCPDLCDETRRAFARDAAAAGIPTVETTVEPFRKAAYRTHPDGLLAIARSFPTGLDRVPRAGRRGPPLLLVVESIEKPGNLGTMLRTAEGAGADAVLVASPTTDVFNPNVVRSSQGALFLIPVAVAATDEVRAALETRGITAFAASPAADREVWDADLTGPAAIVVGSEHAGLSPAWDGGTVGVRLPMAGASDSLNAAVAAAVLLYEAVRQRR
jgi:RNA methyltransferase, TrmH family